VRYGSAAVVWSCMFGISPTILLSTGGSEVDMVWAIMTAAVGMAMFASFIHNFMFVKYTIAERIIAVITALLFIQSDLISDSIGFGLFILLVLYQLYKKKKREPAAA